ncbi:coenzyme F420-0:L-glutamate ligase [Candidatus Microgenomates bacterium]|nr:coenzyme F420-0:L-glutamate ligase [Candidatus Microgenomates bacterium]
MIVTPYKTHKILPNENLFTVLDKYLPPLEEKSIVAIASKVVGICEGRVVKIDENLINQKDNLVKQEADYYLPRESNQYNFMLTINQQLLVASAGIDESNSNGYYSMWPKDPQKSVNAIREHLTKKYAIKEVGIIMTDSKLSPLRYGVTGYAIAHSGFEGTYSYVGKPDIFGEIMRVEKTNLPDSLATTATLVMGEGDEQQPIAVITNAPFITFQQRNPTAEELKSVTFPIEDDVYGDLLTSVTWQKGKKHE